MSEHSFANNFWGKDDQGVHNVFLRMKHSKQTNEEVRLFYKERIAIEEEYAKRMLALSRKGLGAVETGTLQACLETIRQDTEAMGKSHATAAQQLRTQLEEPLVAFNNSMRERRKTTQQTVEKLLKAKILQNSNVEKAREKFELDCNKINGYYAQQNLLLGKELEKNNQKLDKTHMSVNATKRDYQTQLRNLADIMDRWNKEWKVACDKLQDIEEERINFLKSNLWGYTNIVSTVCVSDDECCENIRLALEKTDVQEDIIQFVRDNASGSEIQDPPEFINFLNGHSHDNVEPTFKVAQFPRVAGGGGEADDSMDEITSVMDPSYEVFEQAIPDPKPSPLHNIAQTAKDVFSFKLNKGDKPDSVSTDMHESVNSDIRSSVNSESSWNESSSETRSWATPFRRRSKKDLNKGWNRSQSREAGESRTPHESRSTPHEVRTTHESRPTGRSATYDAQSSYEGGHSPLATRQGRNTPMETREALSVGNNTFDLGPSSNHSKSPSHYKSSSTSSQPINKLSRDDPLVAALEQLKLSVGSNSSSTSAPETEPHNAKYGNLGGGQPVQQRRVASRSAPSSPGRTFEPSYLSPPAPAFTARDMKQTSQQYSTNMFGENVSRDQHSPRETREPVHRKPVSNQASPSERGRAPRTQQIRPKSYYEGASADEIQRQLYAENHRSVSPALVGDNHYPRSVSPDPRVRSVSPNPRANPYSEPLHGRSQPNLYQHQSQQPLQAQQPLQPQQRPPRSHTPQGRSYDPYTNSQYDRPRSKSIGEPRVDPRMDPRFNPDPRMSSPRGAPQLPRVSSDGRPVISYSRAQYDYRAAIPEEVSFRKGEVMLVLRMQDDGWWEVEVYGRGNRTGLAPSNFLADI